MARNSVIKQKRYEFDEAKLEQAQKLLGAKTETETIERALDEVISERENQRCAWAATESSLKNGAVIAELTESRQYPEKGDSFHSLKGDRLLSTHAISNQWIVYAQAYKDAADKLVESITTLDEILAVPIMFLYRHHLELSLKYQAWQLEGLSQEKIPRNRRGKQDKDYDHDLLWFWQYVRRNIRYTGWVPEQKVLDAVERLVKEIHELDPYSMSFRYSQDTKHVPTLKPKSRPTADTVPAFIMDADNWKEMIGRISAFLDEVLHAVEAVEGY